MSKNAKKRKERRMTAKLTQQFEQSIEAIPQVIQRRQSKQAKLMVNVENWHTENAKSTQPCKPIRRHHSNNTVLRTPNGVTAFKAVKTKRQHGLVSNPLYLKRCERDGIHYTVICQAKSSRDDLAKLDTDSLGNAKRLKLNEYSDVNVKALLDFLDIRYTYSFLLNGYSVKTEKWLQICDKYPKLKEI